MHASPFSHASVLNASVLNAIVIAAVAIGVLAVAGYWNLAARRRARRRAQWEAVADALVGLDSELDRFWASEIQRQRGPGR